MKKTLLIFFIFLVTIPHQAFSLTYDKKTNKQLFADGKISGGYTDEIGHYGKNNSDFENCKKLNANYSGLRQGKKIHYSSDKKLKAIENGIFDCAYTSDNAVAFYLVEGIIEYHDRNSVILHFKNDFSNQHIYEKMNGAWVYYTKNKNYPAPSPSSYRPATQQEIQHAEKLYSLYKNIDLSGSSAKIYNIINKQT
jgi:hypothetical protein